MQQLVGTLKPRSVQGGLLAHLFMTLAAHRQLLWQMAKREIRDRYAGQALGSLWAIGHPIFLMALYVFLFSYIFPSRTGVTDGAAGSMVVYILAGLIPWLTFAESMSRGTSAILSEAGLVKQVVFPIEILPVKSVIAASLSQVVAMTMLLLYMLATESHLPLSVLLLPALFLLQIGLMIGVSYALSSLGVYFRDLKEIVQVFLSAGIFLAPILYPASIVTKGAPLVATLFALNPFSHLVWCYQDALYYGHVEHPLSWLVLTSSTPVILYLGYRIFRKLRVMFGEVL
ncbi:MAG TPA: ABC transporter permease [Nitrospira sp.]|nr:ABC transporter permease [Nitrospira sp.]